MNIPRWLPGFVMLLGHNAAVAAEPQRFEFSEPHMGTTVRITLYAADSDTAKAASKAAFARVAELNRIMSDYDPESELMRLCTANAEKAGTPVKVSPELFFVLSKGQEVAKLSDGAFDMTVGPLVKLWRQSRRTQRLPDAKALAEAKARVGYQKIQLDEHNQTVRLLTPGMQLDLGGIAKGFAADEILVVLRLHNITRALAAVGGDIAAGDAPPGRDGWVIDVAPLTETKPAHRLQLANAAVSTSGDREQFVVIDGVRYSHVVDPRTGLGQTGQRSLTVIAPRGIIADSMTKAVALMEPRKALELINNTPGASALIVVKAESGERVLVSRRFDHFLVKHPPPLPIQRLDLVKTPGQLMAVIVRDAPLVHTGQLLPPKTAIDAGDLNAQWNGLFATLRTVLRENGSELSLVAKLNFYVTELKHVAAVRKKMEEAFKAEAMPAVSFVVTRLPVRGADIAVDAVAVSTSKTEAVRLMSHASIQTIGKSATAALMPASSPVYISGQAEKGATPAEATRKTLESLRATMKWLGLNDSHIVQLKSFLKPMTAIDEVTKEFTGFFGEGKVPPLVFVEWESSLPSEIELIAHSPMKPVKDTQPVEHLTPPGMSASPIYCRVTRVNSNSLIYVSGLYAEKPGSGAEEVEGIFRQLGELLGKAGSDFEHLAKATYYVSNDDTSKKLNELRPKYYDPKRPPAASKAMVRGVGMENRGITLDMIAVPLK